MKQSIIIIVTFISCMIVFWLLFGLVGYIVMPDLTYRQALSNNSVAVCSIICGFSSFLMIVFFEYT